MELVGPLPDSLDNVYITSTTDTAYFKKEIETSKYLVITADSLKSNLEFDQELDTLQLNSDSIFLGGYLSYNNSGDIKFPNSGQSLCLYEERQGREFYIDNSPTFGAANDTVDAQGKMVIQVNNSSSGIPLSQINIWEEHIGDIINRLNPNECNYVGATDSEGKLEVQGLSGRHILWLSKYDSIKSYQEKHVTETIYPDKVTKVNIKMDTTTSSINSSDVLAKNYKLSNNYPNPFNSSTTFDYKLPINDYITLSLFNPKGQLVRKVSSGYKPAGKYKVNMDFSGLPSGVYFYRLQTGNRTITKKCMFLK